jgi:hypothetical protein
VTDLATQSRIILARSAQAALWLDDGGDFGIWPAALAEGLEQQGSGPLNIIPAAADVVEYPAKVNDGLEVRQVTLQSWIAYALIPPFPGRWVCCTFRAGYAPQMRTWFVKGTPEFVDLDERFAIYGGWLAYQDMMAASGETED